MKDPIHYGERTFDLVMDKAESKAELLRGYNCGNRSPRAVRAEYIWTLKQFLKEFGVQRGAELLRELLTERYGEEKLQEKINELRDNT